MGLARGSPQLHPSAGEEAPAHIVSGWMGGREATVGERPDVPGCPRRAVAASAGVGGPWDRVLGPERKCPALSRNAQPGLGRRGQQGGVTGGEGPWSWGHCMILSRHAKLT